MIPFIILGLIPLIYATVKCLGADTFFSQSIFSFSFIEIFSWIMMIPVMNNIATSMVMLSFIVLRIIISIVSYETFYKKNLGELSEKLL